MIRVTLLGILVSAFFTSNAWTGNTAIGGKYAGMGYSSVAFSDGWSSFNNQAGLANLENPFAGVSYENRFLLSQLGYKSIAIAYPIKNAGFGLSYSGFGYSSYNENRFGLSYGQKLGEQFSAGVQLNYLSTKIGDIYGSTGGLMASIGIQAKLNDNITFGAHVDNLNRLKLADYNNERVPTIIRLGINYKLSETVITTAEVEKDVDAKYVIKGGVEYHPNDMLYLRAGVSSSPMLGSFGVGIKISEFHIDISSAFHQTLGAIPQLSLSYNFSKP